MKCGSLAQYKQHVGRPVGKESKKLLHVFLVSNYTEPRVDLFRRNFG